MTNHVCVKALGKFCGGAGVGLWGVTLMQVFVGLQNRAKLTTKSLKITIYIGL